MSDKSFDHAWRVHGKLVAAGLRSEANLSSDRVGYMIRDASLQEIPYVIVVGEKEVAAENLNARCRSRGELGAMSTEAFPSSIALERSPGARRS